MKFDNKYFSQHTFSKAQVEKNLGNAVKDLNIAKKDDILDVKFNYAYSALLKAGIALLSQQQIKIKSTPGHHIKIIEILAELLKDDSIADIGDAMRSKRNLDMYSGGIDITEKECEEYIGFASKVVSQVKAAITF